MLRNTVTNTRSNFYEFSSRVHEIVQSIKPFLYHYIYIYSFLIFLIPPFNISSLFSPNLPMFYSNRVGFFFWFFWGGGG
jgi:hypothetical protein